ncbi:unnamed protein product [Linum tenue]|uniref:Uncharacterized protein n=1 Tax=Linum tenue TaxID=586396 RepID=A0AAV0LQM3_9ROSI|nr:unnamed protein product [Linum tenue]
MEFGSIFKNRKPFLLALSAVAHFPASSPPGSRRSNRKMADIEPPSFSLGFDLDFDAEPEPEIPPPSPPRPTSSCRLPPEEHDEDGAFEASVAMDSEDEQQNGEDKLTTPPFSRHTILKRLRRGPAIKEPRTGKSSIPCVNADDDIEDFSSDDGDDFVADLLPSRQHSSVCSSGSKVTLRGSGVLTGQSSRQSSVAKGKGLAFKTPASSSLETGHSGLVFPKLTTSPLRRFQLIDSDDEPTLIGNNVNRKPERVGSQSAEHSGKSSGNNRRIEDLWKDFSPMQNVRIATPALDDFCNEYFQSVKDKDAAANRRETQRAGHDPNRNAMGEFEQCWNVDDPLPPAHHYFFNDDARIRSIVHDRLPHFFPLGVVKARGNLLPSESVIDYMSQFGGTPQDKGTGGSNMDKGSTSKGRKRARKSDAKGAASQGWVDPRTSAGLPKDAGKRRVQASGQAAAGHWFTSPEGRKVYVSRNGQELTGQAAYRHFKRDSGGYRKTRKKATSKRKKA